MEVTLSVQLLDGSFLMLNGDGSHKLFSISLPVGGLNSLQSVLLLLLGV